MDSGQSGGSAPYVAWAIRDCVYKLCMQTPISPISWEEDEWIENQNKRLSSLFRDKKWAYYLNAIVWKWPEDYDTFIWTINGVKSRQYVRSFPFTTKTFYIDVLSEERDEEKHRNWERDRIEWLPWPMAYKIKDREQLKEVFEYYKE